MPVQLLKKMISVTHQKGKCANEPKTLGSSSTTK